MTDNHQRGSAAQATPLLTVNGNAAVTVSTDSLLAGRHVRLEAIMPADIGALYELELSEGVIGRWRFRGATPSPEQHARSLWDMVLATMIVRGKGRGDRVGLVTAYKASLANGYAYLGVAAWPEYEQSGLAIEGLAVFIDYCFRTWNFRKLHVDTLEFNRLQYASFLDAFFIEEGRIRDAEFFDGAFWDRVILTLDRDRWMDVRATVMSWAGDPGLRRTS